MQNRPKFRFGVFKRKNTQNRNTQTSPATGIGGLPPSGGKSEPPDLKQYSHIQLRCARAVPRFSQDELSVKFNSRNREKGFRFRSISPSQISEIERGRMRGKSRTKLIALCRFLEEMGIVFSEDGLGVCFKKYYSANFAEKS